MSTAFDRAQEARDNSEHPDYYRNEPPFDEGDEVIMSDGDEGTILRIFHEWDEGYREPMIELETSPEIRACGLGWETFTEAETITALYHDILKGA